MNIAEINNFVQFWAHIYWHFLNLNLLRQKKKKEKKLFGCPPLPAPYFWKLEKKNTVQKYIAPNFQNSKKGFFLLRILIFWKYFWSCCCQLVYWLKTSIKRFFGGLICTFIVGDIEAIITYSFDFDFLKMLKQKEKKIYSKKVVEENQTIIFLGLIQWARCMINWGLTNKSSETQTCKCSIKGSSVLSQSLLHHTNNSCSFCTCSINNIQVLTNTLFKLDQFGITRLVAGCFCHSHRNACVKFWAPALMHTVSAPSHPNLALVPKWPIINSVCCDGNCRNDCARDLAWVNSLSNNACITKGAYLYPLLAEEKTVCFVSLHLIQRF